MPFNVVVADLSFISLRKVLPNVAALMPGACEGLFLVKPQFEVGPENVGKGGLVTDDDATEAALGGLLLHSLPVEPWWRLALSTLAGAVCLALVGLSLKPWRPAA